MMLMRCLASLALIFSFAAAAEAQTRAELQNFKAQALAKFSMDELGLGHGLSAVRLALAAARTPELSETAHDAAFGALARAVSETDEFAALGAEDFGLPEAFNVIGMFLPGGRYYVAAASDTPMPEGRGVVLLVDVQTGRVLDRRESDVGQVTQIAGGGFASDKVLLQGATGALTLMALEGGRFDAGTALSFGGDGADNSRVSMYLSADAQTVFRIDPEGPIVALDIASGEVTTAPEIPVETGPGKSRPGSGARSETLISAALNARYFSLNTAQKLHGGRILLGRHFSLARNTLVNAQSGETRPVALPESIGKRAGRFSLNPGSGRALVRIRGRGPAIVDLNDPAVMILPDDARDDEIPIAHASARDHWLTATPTSILTRDGRTGRLIGWYTHGDGSGRRPEFELGYAQNVMAITQGNRIRFLRLFFEERPHSTDVSPDGGRILAAHRAYPQSYVSSASPGGQVIETPIPDIEIARIIAGPGETVAALDTEGRFHYWPDGLDGRRMDPDIPTVDMTNAGFDHIPFLFGADFLAIGGYHGPCGLWSLTDWRRISGFTHAGCSVDAFVYDAARNRLAVLGGFDGNVSVYDAGSGEFLAHFRKQEPLTDTTNLSAANAWFSQDGESLHIVGARGWQVDLDIETGALARGEDLPRDSAIRVARNGQAAVTTGHDENGSYMSLPGRSALIRPPEGWSFSRTALSADGGTIASYLSAHDGNAVRLALIDAAKGRILLTYSLPLFDSRFPEGHLRFSPDGRWITAFETPGRVWRFPTTEAGLIDLATTRFGEMTATDACRWFMCK